MPIVLPGMAPDAKWTLVCLCAEWCDTCRDYQRAFEQHAQLRSDAIHVWLDIEDDSDWLGDIDLETLPTLLVLHGDRPMFFGPVLPHLDVVDRTLRALRDNGPTGDPVPHEFKDAVDRVIRQLAEP